MTEAIFDMQDKLERITVFTPLGIRFWDPVRDMQVRDGLMVTARPVIATSPPVIMANLSVTTAIRTASGVYAFHGLPGLHDIEYPVKDSGSVASPPTKRPFIIKVEDKQRRFLPAVFSVELPLDYKGFFLNGVTSLTGSSPPVASPPISRPPGFYLFSAPTRPVVSGLAAVRGRLVKASKPECPAAHAVLEVQFKDKKWYGVSDKRGCVAVLFPYPVPNSALGSNQKSLHEQQWKLTIRVRYNPDALIFPLGLGTTPDLCSIFKQSPGVIWPTQLQSPITESPVTEWSTNLEFGQELVLRTDELSELWIDTGISPP
jgi:hypothetical protein